MKWKHPIAFTEDQFMARNRSSSYAKKEGEEGFSAFLQDLRRVFQTYETDGYYVNGYETLDDAFNECVAVNMDIYNYQSSIEEASESE